MSFSSESGYIPVDFDALISVVREGINEQFGTDYDVDSFLGTNFYKYFYALIQRLQENEVKTSEIFAKLQEYFTETNEAILRPQTTNPGVVDFLASKGYLASSKPPEPGDEGKAFICVDVDDDAEDYDAKKLEICGYIKDCIVAGVHSQGTESESITLSNGQAFDFKFNLPTEIPVLLRLTLTQSENNLFTVADPEDTEQLLYDNIVARYKLGKNFEPQRYFSLADAEWCESVLLEWSDDAGSNWHEEVYDSDFDEVFTFTIDDITLVEA